MQQHICYGCMKPITEYVCPHCGWSAGQNNQPHQLRTGTLLRGQFLVGRVLGQGGFGITYIGMDVKQIARASNKAIIFFIHILLFFSFLFL